MQYYCQKEAITFGRYITLSPVTYTIGLLENKLFGYEYKLSHFFYADTDVFETDRELRLGVIGEGPL